MNKCCNKCKIEKSLVEFSKDKSKKDGLQSKCRSCANQYKKQYHIDNPEYQKQYNNNMSAVYGIYGDNLCLYIGKSIGINSRWKDHKYFIKHPKAVEKYQPKSINLYNNIRLHSNVELRIIEESSPETLITLEQHYIHIKKPLYNIYNA